VNIGQKYPREQFRKLHNNFYTLYQEDRDEFIQVGHYPYSLDFERFNSEDGVALTLEMVDEDGVRHHLTTFSTAGPHDGTIVGEDAQANSSFEIVKVGTTPKGNAYVEAKFNATVFGNERGRITDFKREVTDGFVRFPITYMD
jgi:hypothetical protein